MPMQTVREVMTSQVVTLPRETTLAEAARTMREQDIGDIVVSSALGLVVLLRHLGSLRRLLRGSEPDFRSAPDTHGESVGP